MNREQVRNLLEAVKGGELATADALERLSNLPFTDLPDARVDTHRALRHGIPDTAKEKPQEGKVIAVGKGKVSEDGKLQKLDVKKGDKVLFSKYAGTEINIKGVEHLIIREDDVLGVVE